MATKKELLKLFEEAQEFRYDPLGFVLWAWPWGQEGTALEAEDGPEDWQAAFLLDLGRELDKRKGDLRLDSHEAMSAIQMATASGHGVGKSALVAWLVVFFLATRVAPQIVVTANTENQLSTKTWRELHKWYHICRVADWFEWTATKFYVKGRHQDWFAQAIPWSEEKPEAFAGTHADTVVVIMDEASAIADVIWEVTEGALTDGEAVWLCFGNPTRNTGRFYQSFNGPERERWVRRRVDSRTVKRTNKAQIADWAKHRGEDSDFFRIRVRGEFPRSSDEQFIEVDLVDQAMERGVPPAAELAEDDRQQENPIVIGVDVAYRGSANSVITVRQGRYVLDRRVYSGLDGFQLAGYVAEAEDKYRPDAIVMEAAGVSTEVVGELKRRGIKIHDLFTGRRAQDDKTYFNLRSEMWGKTRDWLRQGGCLPMDEDLKNDLIGIHYSFDRWQRIQLESKDDMRRRGLASPDHGDSLALTFAVDVRPTRRRVKPKIVARPPTFDELLAQQTEPDPFDHRI